MSHQSAYSWRAKIGLIVPPTNTVNEAEWVRLLPEGVTHHAVRMKLHKDSHTEEGRKTLLEDIGKAVADLVPARVDVIAYGCTAGSMMTPCESLPDEIAKIAGRPAVATAPAIVQALRALGVTKVAVATPYRQATNDHEVHFLADHGIEVLNISGLGIGTGSVAEIAMISATPLEAVAAHARAAFRPGAEALVISCTDFPTLPLIAELEAELGVPVITSNTATLWAALRAAGVTDPLSSGGRLLM